MAYYISKTVESDFEVSLQKVNEMFQEEGFGVVSIIDIPEKLKETIGVDFRKYTILGMCNPSFAHKALLMEDKIGALLPCNVIVQEQENGQVEVSVVDPLESMQAVKNAELGAMANEIRKMLVRAIEKV